MNKDVIYVEPEDDITDIITKIENAKEKIVALVPPKKASVFRSIVNIKLINKAGFSADKKIVLVTTDPSVVKLAAVAKLPVTKSLQAAPAVPELEGEVDATTHEELTKTDDGEVKSEEAIEPLEEEKADSKDEAGEEEPKEGTEKAEGEKKESADKKDEKDSKKAEKKEKTKGGNWFTRHKIPLIVGSVSFVILLLLAIWMFVIAPSASITVSVRVEEKSFSESATFVTSLQEEVASEGKFYIEEKSVEEKQEKSFEATGQKNVGEKAKGELVVTAAFKHSGSTSVEAGDTFSNGNLSYTVDEGVTLSWAGNNATECDNRNATATDFIRDGCIISKTVNITAVEPGEKYNLPATSANWRSDTGFGAYTTTDITGGTDKMITVVQQSDIDAALAELGASNEEAGRNKLNESIEGKQLITIDSSFSMKTADPVSTPALGEKVEAGQRVKLTVTTTYSISVIDKTKVEDYISAKFKLDDGYKIYEIQKPYVDNYIRNDSGITGRLKAETVYYGSKITENDVVEIAKGKGLGTAQHELSSVSGVSKITIEPSYPWVTSIPNNPDKIRVTITTVKSGE